MVGGVSVILGCIFGKFLLVFLEWYFGFLLGLFDLGCGFLWRLCVVSGVIWKKDVLCIWYSIEDGFYVIYNGVWSIGGIGLIRFKIGEKLGYRSFEEGRNRVVWFGYDVSGGGEGRFCYVRIWGSEDGLRREVVVMFVG